VPSFFKKNCRVGGYRRRCRLKLGDNFRDMLLDDGLSLPDGLGVGSRKVDEFGQCTENSALNRLLPVWQYCFDPLKRS